MNLKKLIEELREYAFLTLGVCIFVFAWGCFMIPNEMASGGLTGLCAIIQLASGLPVWVSYVVLNVILLIIGFLILGNAFGFRTIYCISLSTLLFALVKNIDVIHSLPGHFLYVPERFLLPVIAGLFEAVGVGMIFHHGGSTGGSDIIALIINKYWPISPGKVFLATDIVIIATMLLVPGKTFADLIYGYLMMITFSLTIDGILIGRKSSVQLLVFSEKYAMIADHIIYNMDRGVTVLHAMGWYTKQDKNVLLILVRRHQMQNLTKAIKEIDPRAFVSVTQARGVFGEGFEEIKVGLSRKKK